MIKHLIIAVGILAVGSVASARDIRVTAGQIQGQAQGQLQGQQQSATTGNVSNNYENFRNAPAFGAPGLAASDEACMGSSSGGAGVSAGAVGVSVTFGSTWESYNCNLRMFAQQLRLAGAPKAAIMILANHPEVKKALQEAGTLPADPVVTAPTPTTPRTVTASSDKHPACSPTSWATAETRKALGC